MSVAENSPVPSVAVKNPQQQVAIRSFIGAVVILAALGLVFGAIPYLWWQGWESAFVGNETLKNNVFLSEALLILLELAVITGLGFEAYRASQQLVDPGVRSGIALVAVVIFIALNVCVMLGDTMEQQYDQNIALGWAVVCLVFAAIIAGVGYLLWASPAVFQLLVAVQDQNWFHLNSYKGNQGVRVRRGTIAAAIAVLGCGVATMNFRGLFGSTAQDAANDWIWRVPFTADANYHGDFIPVLYKVHIMLPLLLSVGLIWLAWRIVNVPGFADFLIATEAEMNKVSWTSRRRLIQDTIVVLVTVVLFTGFLFVVDIIWIRVLSAPGIRVLLIDSKEEQQKQQEKAQW